MTDPKLYICTGAGVSAESGIPTFRSGSDGLWEDFDVDIVCNIDTFEENYTQVHEFYDARRVALADKKPNSAHIRIAELQKEYGTDRVKILTTNVDNLHEQAGAEEVIHLHGLITEVEEHYGCPERSNIIDIGNKAIDKEWFDEGAILKPNVVFFYESAPKYSHLNMLNETLANGKDIFLVIGASFEVLAFHQYAAYFNGITYNINPEHTAMASFNHNIQKNATEGMEHILEDVHNIMRV